MPFKTEHAARQRSPDKYDKFRRKHLDGWPEGIDVVLGIKDGKSEIQSIRFDASKWTPKEAKKWLKAHGFVIGNFEPAKESNVEKQFLVPIAKLDEEKHLVTGPVLIPNMVDLQGDVATAGAIEDAAHDYMVRSRLVKDMHEEPADVYVVESWTLKRSWTIDDVKYPKGTWFLTVKVVDDDLWEAVKQGERRGFSVGGKALTEPIEDEG